MNVTAISRAEVRGLSPSWHRLFRALCCYHGKGYGFFFSPIDLQLNSLWGLRRSGACLATVSFHLWYGELGMKGGDCGGSSSLQLHGEIKRPQGGPDEGRSTGIPAETSGLHAGTPRKGLATTVLRTDGPGSLIPVCVHAFPCYLIPGHNRADKGRFKMCLPSSKTPCL